MEETNLIFTNYKFRCSQLGNIMTCLPKEITQEQLDRIKELEKERDEGINVNGNTVKWTQTKIDELAKLKKIEGNEDELPEGAKTFLDSLFRSVFWGRRRILANKFLSKGLFCEDDAIGLLSKIDNEFYTKNKTKYQNEFIEGEPDMVAPLYDTKANWDLETYENAELISLYDWQIKGYSFMLKVSGGTLAYTLVNSPLHEIINERNRMLYAVGNPDSENEEWKEICKQIERNHIFDVQAFQKAYPFYQFENVDEQGQIIDFSIPAELRVKKFAVTLTDDDIYHIKRRVLMCREYLVNKEIEVRDRLKQINQP